MNIKIVDKTGTILISDTNNSTEAVSVSSEDFYEYCINQISEQGCLAKAYKIFSTGYFGNIDNDQIIATAVFDDPHPIHNRYVIELKAKQRNLLISVLSDNQLVLNVGCPRTIVSVDVLNDQLQNIYVYGIENNEEPVNNDTLLYQFPFGNVDKNGLLCTGNIDTKYDNKKPGSLVRKMEKILYETVFNGDYNDFALSLIQELSGNDFSNKLFAIPLGNASKFLKITE